MPQYMDLHLQSSQKSFCLGMKNICFCKSVFHSFYMIICCSEWWADSYSTVPRTSKCNGNDISTRRSAGPI